MTEYGKTRPEKGTWVFCNRPDIVRRLDKILFAGRVSELKNGEPDWLIPYDLFIEISFNWLPSFGHERALRSWWFKWPIHIQVLLWNKRWSWRSGF